MTSLDQERYLKLKKYSARLSSKPGVYCMLNENGKVIYVGKAKNLKKRVSSYFGKTTHLPKNPSSSSGYSLDSSYNYENGTRSLDIGE